MSNEPPPEHHPRVRLQGYDYASPEDILSLTICSRDPRPVLVSPGLPETMVENLNWTPSSGRLIVYAYCIMPDHLHLVVRVGAAGLPLGDAVGRFKSYTDRQYRAMLPGNGFLWQHRFYDRIVRVRDGELGAIAYVLENPVRKGMVETPEEYPWSGRLDYSRAKRFARDSSSAEQSRLER